MLQVPAGQEQGSTPARTSENNATSPASAWSSSSTFVQGPKLQSCVLCRRRKVRCDKQKPCSNCRRANVACTFPSTDRPPRWARRLERLTNNAAASNAPAPHGADPGVGKVMDRLQSLESLVKDLKGQLQQAQSTASPSGGSPGVGSPDKSPEDRVRDAQRQSSTASDTTDKQKHFGRLVEGGSRSRYVSSGFWSRVNDELEGLRMDTHSLAGDDSESSDDGASTGKSNSTYELQRAPIQRNAFLFQHSISSANQDLRELHPLPSQTPFLLDVFSENVNFIMQFVHMPTVRKMVRDLRTSDTKHLTPANEALMFSIYYAAITSMEDDDVMSNFGSSKTDLNLKYRIGLEHALAKADFLNAPDIVLVQSLAIFLCLARRYDSPKFVWMMMGLLIRMAQYLGLQRDGTHFEHMTPFDIEMRRRVWWALCSLDMRASEDQGTELTIKRGTFDTRIPLNINDADIDPASRQLPEERIGVTDASQVRLFAESWDIMTQLMAPGGQDVAAGLEVKDRLLDELYHRYEQNYFRYPTETDSVADWVLHSVAGLVVAKMRLLVFLPILFSSPDAHLSDEIRVKLLISAIEVAEYNHSLNARESCKQWRWVFQVYTHWYAIVYLLIEINRRPWSPIIERAWNALHSSWLIPAHISVDKNLHMWFPLRKMMIKARKHRDTEKDRLRADPPAVAALDLEDRKLPLPSSSGHIPIDFSVEALREHWLKLVTTPQTFTQGQTTSSARLPSQSVQATMKSAFEYSPNDSSSMMEVDSIHQGATGGQAARIHESTFAAAFPSVNVTDTLNGPRMEQTAGGPPNSHVTSPEIWPGNDGTGLPWLWADVNPSADVFPSFNVDYANVNVDNDSDVNWYDWFESAKNMEWNS